MLTADLYTKTVLTIIAICLVVLCIEQSHWNHLETVQAQTGGVLIRGYIVTQNGSPRTVLLGGDGAQGVPVIVTNR